MSWKKDCPQCGSEQNYCNKYVLRLSVERNTSCNPCRGRSMKIQYADDRYERQCSDCDVVIVYNRVGNRDRQERAGALCKSCSKLGENNPMKNYVWSEEQLKYMSESRKGKATMLGFNWTDDQKLKHSKTLNDFWKTPKGILARKKMSKNNAKYWLGKKRPDFGCPGYNKLACKYFDWLNMYMGWNGQHALKGGEKQVGKYFVDYYEPSLNLVIEWDEPYHNNPKQIIKDIKRQNIIVSILKCDFIRLKQKNIIR